MRIRDLLQFGTYIKKFEGFNRHKRRELASKARKKGVKNMSPRNWVRDKHKRRKLRKERRKQSWS